MESLNSVHCTAHRAGKDAGSHTCVLFIDMSVVILGMLHKAPL